MANISQRITLEGGEDIRAKLEALARAATEAFRQIQAGADKVKIDPAATRSVEELATASTRLAGEFSKVGEAASSTAPAIQSTGTAAGEAKDQFDGLAEAEIKVAEGLGEITKASQQVAGPVQEGAEKGGLAYAGFALKAVQAGAAVVSAGADIATAGAAVSGVGLQAITAAAAVGTFALSLGSTLVSAIGLAVPALAGLAKGLAEIASADAKLAATLQNLQRSTKDIGLDFAGLQRAQDALKQIGLSGDEALKVIGKLAEELQVKPDEAAAAEKRKSLETTIKQLEFEREIVRLQLERGFITAGGTERIKELTSQINSLNAELAKIPGSAANEKIKEVANDLSLVTQAMREVAAGAKGMTFNELTTAETKLQAVKKTLQDIAAAGGNVVQAFANIIANLPKEDALAIGKAFGLTEADVTRLQRFGAELGKIDALTRRISEAGVTISPGDADAFDRMEASLQRLSSAWERLKQSLASSVFSRLAAEGAAAFANLASVVIEETAAVIEAFNFVFAAIVTEAGKVAAAFGAVLAPIGTILSQIVQGWIFIFQQLGAAALEIGNQIVEGWAIIFQKIGEAVSTPISGAWEWLKSTFQSVLDAIAAAWASFKSTFGFGGGEAPAGATGGQFAGGGLLGGRGTGTSDSNLAWVSRGEYITPARAVAQPGVLAFLEALRRSGGNLRHVLDGMGRFALGGLVPGRLGIPAFAGGGMNAVTIQFPGLPEITGLRASSAVVDELRHAAALAQVRSGGRKPSRYS